MHIQSWKKVLSMTTLTLEVDVELVDYLHESRQANTDVQYAVRESLNIEWVEQFLNLGITALLHSHK